MGSRNGLSQVTEATYNNCNPDSRIAHHSPIAGDRGDPFSFPLWRELRNDQSSLKVPCEMKLPN